MRDLSRKLHDGALTPAEEVCILPSEEDVYGLNLLLIGFVLVRQCNFGSSIWPLSFVFLLCRMKVMMNLNLEPQSDLHTNSVAFSDGDNSALVAEH